MPTPIPPVIPSSPVESPKFENVIPDPASSERKDTASFEPEMPVTKSKAPIPRSQNEDVNVDQSFDRLQEKDHEDKDIVDFF